MNRLISYSIVILVLSFVSGKLVNVNKNSPPRPDQIALMARYIVHNTDWTALSTISTLKTTLGYPFVSVKSFCDGPIDNSTGIPYFYITSMDVSGADIVKNNAVTIMVTLSEVNYCKDKNYDPQDPRCPKVLISGKFLKLDNSTAEYFFALEALFERHPAMKTWPEDHGFYVGKVDIEQICLLDRFGGIQYVKPQDYYHANLTRIVNVDSYKRRIAVTVNTV
ncbi:hypothetical protein GWI33_019565 [Rhynchophorus ferrugineus]|uniref:CREG-like beta-barrel domain-containing protein n=1 Tax=Rhynchophorus ferrugineus TaxID=354439 RepID=A0A834HU52_RHYFE|nr:hypothetical protein GWI33_019565 [Rhynchophorus ferrugineus]